MKKPTQRITARYRVAIDDSKTNLLLMCSYLSRLGYKTVSAMIAAEALEKFRRTRPEVVVIDKHLGDEDGLSLVASLRELSPEASTAIYLVTADIYCQANLLDDRLGISAVLHKPLKYQELKKVFDSEIDNSTTDDDFSELRSRLQKDLVTQLPIDLSELLNCYHSRDAARVGLIVHRIRGASANAGLKEIEERCSAVEAKLNEADSEAYSAAVIALS